MLGELGIGEGRGMETEQRALLPGVFFVSSGSGDDTPDMEIAVQRFVRSDTNGLYVDIRWQLYNGSELEDTKEVRRERLRRGLERQPPDQALQLARDRVELPFGGLVRLLRHLVSALFVALPSCLGPLSHLHG